jgi:putative membrane protein
MVGLLVKWLLQALALLITAEVVPGFHVRSIGAALVAVLVIGLLNVTLGAFLKIVLLPFGVLTLGLFFLVINAFILKLAGDVVPGFYVATWGAALIGAIVLAVLQMVFKALSDRD